MSEKKKGKNIPDITYEFAMSEIGRNAGLDTENGKRKLSDIQT